jgi:hypothetical protein
MNGVLASFGGAGIPGADGSAKGKGKGKGNGEAMEKMNAHPIVGWKGFEDVVTTIPGSTVDILQKGVESNARGPSRQCRLSHSYRSH